MTVIGPGYYLLLVSIVWLRYMIPRIPRDIEEFTHAKEPLDRAILIVLWAITAFFLCAAGYYGWRLLQSAITLLLHAAS